MAVSWADVVAVRSLRAAPEEENHRMYRCIGSRRWLATTASAIGLVLGTVAPAHADPPGGAPANPFPEMAHISAWYDQFEPDRFFLADHPGVWFLSPSGLNCGIWDRGSFGCSGVIPGAPRTAITSLGSTETAPCTTAGRRPFSSLPDKRIKPCRRAAT